jgi:hypothetical protein
VLGNRRVKTFLACALAITLLAVFALQSQAVHPATKAYGAEFDGQSQNTDKFGVQEIYPTVQDGNEWYVNMNDPRDDLYFRNLGNVAFSKNSDGSWQVSANQIRMEAWSHTDEKWQNVEITEYAKIKGGSNELLQMYSRGGHHTSKDPCLGSAYKARLYGDGTGTWNKEITHPAYAGNRGAVQVTTEPLEGRWVGFKAVIYNFVGSDGNTYVRLESYIDDDVTDENGNLAVANNWKLASVYEDRGGWSTHDTDFDPSCGRDRDEILTGSGGTATQNIAAFRSDDLTWSFKYLSVREIDPSGEKQPEQSTQPSESEDNTNPVTDISYSDLPIIAGQHYLSDTTTTLSAVRLYMQRNEGGGGQVIVGLAKEGRILSTSSIDADDLDDAYTSVIAEFPSVSISGNFDIIVLYDGTADIGVHKSNTLDIPGNYFDKNQELQDYDLAVRLI